MRHATAILLLTLAAACGGEDGSKNLTYPGVDGHAPFFQLAGTAHEPSAAGAVQCQSCHTGDTFRQFTCTGCHTNANPAGADPISRTNAIHTDTSGNPIVVNGVTYAYDSPTCLRCHPDGTVPHPFFPIGAGSVHNRICLACHSNPSDKSNLSLLQCVACHCPPSAGTATPNCSNPQPAPLTRSIVAGHAAVTTDPDPAPGAWGATDARWCLRCHDGATVNTIASHGRQRAPVGMGDAGCAASGCSAGPSDGRHSNHCFECHSSKPPLFGGNQPGAANTWAQDWSATGLVDNTAPTPAQTSCGTCH